MRKLQNIYHKLQTIKTKKLPCIQIAKEFLIYYTDSITINYSIRVHPF